MRYAENVTITENITMSGAVITQIRNVMGAQLSTMIPVKTLKTELIQGSQSK